MHDLDRTLQTLEPETELGEFGEYELANETFETFETFGGPPALHSAASLDEQELNELAGELLAVTNESELGHYANRFYSRYGNYGTSRLRHRGRRRLRRVFRRYYDANAMMPPTLPPPPSPAVEPAVVETVAEPADDGQELEQAFGAARRTVRLAAALAKRSAAGGESSPGSTPPSPPVGGLGGLGGLGAPGAAAQATGQWVRHGRKIVLHGV